MKGSRTWLLWILVIVVAIVLVIATPDSIEPLSVKSTEPDGQKALVDLLTESGRPVAEINMGDIGAQIVTTHPVVYVFFGSNLTPSAVAHINDYVTAGGTVVINLPDETLGFVSDESFAPSAVATAALGACTMEEFLSLPDIRVTSDVTDYLTRGSAGYCFGAKGQDPQGALIVRHRVGDGSIVGIGTDNLFTNEAMGAPTQADQPVEVMANPLVAIRLFGSNPDRTVGFVTSGYEAATTPGDRSWSSYLPRGLQLALVQLVVCGLVYVLYRARRHGRLLDDPLPVQIAGSSYVDAVGDLLRRQGDVNRVAGRLRHTARRDLAKTMALPPTTSPEVLSELLSQRLQHDPHQLHQLLADHPVGSEEALVVLAHSLHTLAEEAST